MAAWFAFFCEKTFGLLFKNKPKNSYLQLKLINSTMDSGKPGDVCGIVQGK